VENSSSMQSVNFQNEESYYFADGNWRDKVLRSVIASSDSRTL
jgi:hypothetical protein